MVIQIIILVLLVALSGFFSGSEVSLLTVSNVRVRMFRKQKRKGAESLHRIKQHPRKMIITILIGNNVVNIVAASLATYIATLKFGSTGVGISTGILTLLVLVFGEITPKTFAHRYAGRIALRVARPIEMMQVVLYPIVALLDMQTSFLERRVHIERSEPITETEIREMIAFGVEEKVVHSEESSIINRALYFADTRVKDIMIPVKEAFMLSTSKTIQGVVSEVIRNGYSRIPVYENVRSNIVGIVLAKDILYEINKDHGEKLLSHVVTDTLFVQDSLRIHTLLKEFQKKFIHFAIVRDSKARVVGIVTLEDLLEELVGEIEDETDAREKDSHKPSL